MKYNPTSSASNCGKKSPICQTVLQCSTSGGGGAISLLVWIAFLIKVYADGNWNVAVATWTLNYLLSSFLWVLMWIIIIFGIPGIVIGLIWWIFSKKGKKLDRLS